MESGRFIRSRFLTFLRAVCWHTAYGGMRELTHLHSRLLTSRLLVTTRICVSQLKHLAGQGKTEASASIEMPAMLMPRLSLQESSPSFKINLPHSLLFERSILPVDTA